MSEQKKDECCSTGGGCCGCAGTKKLIVAFALGLLIFTCGYIFGKGGCPLGASSSKMCPIPQK